MSANNVGIAKKYKRQWYVFDTIDEEVVGDKENGNKRFLEITDSNTLGPYQSLEEVYEKAEADSILGYFEGGIRHYTQLDGVKLVLTYQGKIVKEDRTPDREISDEEKMDLLVRRVQNLESALETISLIHKKFFYGFQQLGVDLDKKLYVETNLIRLGHKVTESSKQDYKLDSKKAQAALEISRYLKRRRWKVDPGAYHIITDWFGLRVMLERDIDGEEIKLENTSLYFLPALTERQAEKLLKDQKENLALILS